MKPAIPMSAWLLSLSVASHSLELSGTVLETDGSPKAGVVVRLANSGDSAVTNASGAWALKSGSMGLRHRNPAASPVSGHLRFRGGRLVVQFDGADLLGRRGDLAATGSLASRIWASRATDVAMDSLVYSWQGRRFLRDTVSQSRSGMVREFDTTWNADPVYGTLTDARDGQTYRTVTIGSRTWMAENLNFKVVNSWCFQNNEELCPMFGRLYTWPVAMGLDSSYTIGTASGALLHQGICPSGWHVPSDAEWDTLAKDVGGADLAATKLKSMSGWGDPGNGTDAYGFRALPAGELNNDGNFSCLGGSTYFWSSSEVVAGLSLAWRRGMLGGTVDLFRDGVSEKLGHSVRCLKGPQSINTSAWNGSITYGSLTDPRDGQIYKTVKIGTQTWMAENLNFKVDSSWWYNRSDDSGAKYGRLYQWSAALRLDDSCNSMTCSTRVTTPHQGVCPSGWHLPRDAEWDILAANVSGANTVATNLKSLNGWSGRNGTDSYGFRALPAGDRDYIDGRFYNVGAYARFWSSSEKDPNLGSFRGLTPSGNDLGWYGSSKKDGYSVRCLKDN
ncbi:MAG TPA: FISUMP domain-containing protein [Fibrobacteria bacterium]|nr:FISUMP domain-containing protein [Fibrobacteria bacterium]